jgi:hypothetical protein
VKSKGFKPVINCAAGSPAARVSIRSAAQHAKDAPAQSLDRLTSLMDTSDVHQ